MTNSGTFTSINQFSKAIGISRNELSKRLDEYKKEKIMSNGINLYNVGLTTVWIYISDKTNEFNWYSQLSQLPHTFLFLTKEEVPFVCFGVVKMPIRWLNEFSRNIDLLKQELKVTIHFKPTSSVDFVRNGGIMLTEAY
jgi:DNA-binding Lrp family transcriptional regulator